MFLFELSGEVLLGQVLEVLVGECVQFVFEPAGEHPLNFLLPALFLEPRLVEELAGAVDVFVVELDAHVAREPVVFGIRAGDQRGGQTGVIRVLERPVN